MTDHASYAKSAEFYDAIYGARGKDYAREAEYVHALIQCHKHSPGHALLDVACGTGGHLGFLRQHYAVEEYFTERHDLAVFRHQDYLEAFHAAGLDVVYDSEGLTGRGLYIGLKPLVTSR